eukprot:GHRQ01039660.1.p1 GENE.GHRQ01039660.1~~GHRQ01039660.1.p1  ORF type:complete len:112 (-),score=7.61 GHRQ01039660.1:243-578(-)
MQPGLSRTPCTSLGTLPCRVSTPTTAWQRTTSGACCPLHCCTQEASQDEYADTGEKARIPHSERPVAKHWNPVGLVICLFYIAAAIYYFVIRATRTLDMGYPGYVVCCSSA